MKTSKTKKKTDDRPVKKLTDHEKCSLSFAIDHENGFVKVSVAGAQARRDYTCHYCKAMVYKKTGQVRRHHFAHYPGASCSYTGESDLHFGAKYYLCEKLRANSPLEIEVPLEIMPDGNLKRILQRARATSYKIPVASFFDNLLAEHQVEKYIGEYEPDVLSTYCGKPLMAWEICHTSPMHDRKISFFEEKKIPYIELEPCEYGKEDYSFTVRQPGNTLLFSTESFSLKGLHDVFAEELQTSVASEVIKYFLDHYQDLINSKLFGDLDLLHQAEIPLNPDYLNIAQPFDVLLDFLANAGTLTIKQDFFKYVAGRQEKLEDLIEIDLVESKHGFVIKLNDKYMDSSLNLCGEFFRQFSDRFCIMAALNQENEILEMKSRFVVRNMQRCELTIENYSEVMPSRWINLSWLAYGKNERGKPCYLITPDETMQEDIVDGPPAVLADPTHACYRFLKDLQKVCDIKLVVGKGKDSRIHVFGLHIEGLYSENDFDHRIKVSLMQGFKKILFSNPMTEASK
ncbi:MAG: hypothetical protein CVV41_16220 [Candidatus Riflebacteria bacterium HGW-Riflebacteria-1]|jgi:hypothetical protein|nr:MAG: hypothetical protein CVV41_16220 [Candidatus Riflebacteria bacterium HGW-Riflebacteria-1]